MRNKEKMRKYAHKKFRLILTFGYFLISNFVLKTLESQNPQVKDKTDD